MSKVKDVHGVVVLKISEVKVCQHECGTFIWPIVNINNSSMLCSLFLAKINLNSCMTVDIWSSFSLVTTSLFTKVLQSFFQFYIQCRRVKYIWNSLNVYYLGFFLTYYIINVQGILIILKIKQNKLLWNDSINLFLFISWKHQQKIILLSFYQQF
jgi:hypothetical protein